MKSTKIIILSLGISATLFIAPSCHPHDHLPPNVEVFEQQDQMGRPAINTVFVNSGEKNTFNITTPTDMGGLFATKFRDKLLALNSGYTTNLLSLDATTFASVLATDVLNVSRTAPTTFYDGTNVLTGRNLSDDVIDVELTLIFGGPNGTANSGLTSDGVSANDKPFLSSFPYMAAPHN